jgi:uncharacterized protein (DUF427 family)
MKTPGPDHPIAITRETGRVTITAGGHVLADTRDALTLREASYPPVHYIPRVDAEMALLERTDRSTHCPYKGDASYFSIPGAPNAVWSYQTPFPAVAEITGYLAFYPDKVEIVATPL